MRIVVLLLAALPILGACAGERPVLIEESLVAESSLLDQSIEAEPSAATGNSELFTSPKEPAVGFEATTTTVQPLEPEGEIAEPPSDVRALISPTGVLMPVTGRADNGYVAVSPCGNDVLMPWGQPLGPTQVVLDPGHGGDERGAVGANGLDEAEVNLRIARLAAAALSDQGISVALTRSADYRIPVRLRAALADALEAEAFVSIHHNSPAAAASDEPGTEVYVQSTSLESSRLGGLIYEDVTARLDRFDMQWVARSDAGVLSVLNDAGDDAYGINRHPSTPSALVEVAYLGNPLEASLIATDDYASAVAEAIAVGIERFLSTDDPGRGFVAANRTFNPSGATGGDRGCVDPPLG